MSTTPHTIPDIEERLRAALAARAELVQPDDLAPMVPIAPLRPRWQSPWVLLASAAAVLLVLGVVLQGVGGGPRSDDVAPSPDPTIELPPDVGRDWNAADLSRPARLDLDGDGEKEKVEFLAEPTANHDGRTRLQTTLSTTGEEAYGVAELGTTIGTNALGPIDADADGDQELVLYVDDVSLGHPVVFDLRDGLLVQAVAEDPDLLVRGHVPVPGSQTEHYELVRIHDYWIEDGRLLSSRSRGSFAAGNMSLLRPETVLLDTWVWRLDPEGVLRPEPAGCMRSGLESLTPCEEGAVEDLPRVTPVARGTFGIGERADFHTGYRFAARIEAFADPSLVVEGSDGRTINHGLEVANPEVLTAQPTSVFSDGASLVVTSASDPSYIQVLAQAGDRLVPLEPVGEVPLRNEGDVRTWLTRDGALVTVVADGDAWRAWQWALVSGTEMAPMPTGTVCFDDVDDPETVRPC
jgi:hypothetical protein